MLLVRPLAGLCNRLRVMSSAMKLSAETGCGVCVYWQTDPEMNTPYHALFNPVRGMRVVDTDYRNYFQRAIFHRHNFMMFRGAAWPVREDATVRARGLRPWAISTCSEFYNGGDYSWLRPRAEIERLVEDVSSTLKNGGGYVGVHIRRTDNAESIAASPTSLFVDRMLRELRDEPKARFFVATDDENAKDELRRQFGAAVITRANVARRDDANGVRDALVDLLLLSRARKLLGSYYSSFSGVAARIGGIPCEIVSLKSDRL